MEHYTVNAIKTAELIDIDGEVIPLEKGDIIIKAADVRQLIKSLPSDDSDEHITLFNGDKVLIDHEFPATINFDESRGEWHIDLDNEDDAETLGLDWSSVNYVDWVDEGYGKIYKA